MDKYDDVMQKKVVDSRSLKKQNCSRESTKRQETPCKLWILQKKKATQFSSIAFYQSHLRMMQKKCAHSLARTHYIAFVFFIWFSHDGVGVSVVRLH